MTWSDLFYYPDLVGSAISVGSVKFGSVTGFIHNQERQLQKL